MKDKYHNHFFKAAKEIIYEISDVDFNKGEVRFGKWSQPSNKISTQSR